MSLLRNTITSSHWHLAQVPCHRLHWPGLIPEQRCEPPCHALSFRRAWHIWHVIFFLLKIKTGLTKPTRHRTCLVCHKFEEIVLSKKNIPTEKRANAWDLPPTILPNQLAKGHATTSASAEDVDCLDAFCGEGRSISAGFSWCLRCVYLAALGANLGACLFLVYSGPPNR